MGFDSGYDPTKHGRRYNVHFVQQYKPPFSRCQELHHLFRLMRPVVRICNHRIRGDHDAALSCKLEHSHVGASIGYVLWN
jgi:hypothetical protein